MKNEIHAPELVTNTPLMNYLFFFSEQRERELRDDFADEKEMSAGKEEKAADGGLENLDEARDPASDRKKEKLELEVEDEKPGEGKNEESKVEDDKSKNIVDVESLEIRVVQEVKKEDEESFRFSASVASLWIPSIVGNQKKKIFLKAGEDKSCAGFPSSNEIFQESQA